MSQICYFTVRPKLGPTSLSISTHTSLSAPLPTLNLLTAAFNFSVNSSYTFSCTNNLFAQTYFTQAGMKMRYTRLMSSAVTHDEPRLIGGAETHASLSRRPKLASDRSLDSSIHVRIFKHNKRSIPTEFQREFLKCRSGLSREDFTDTGRS